MFISRTRTIIVTIKLSPPSRHWSLRKQLLIAFPLIQQWVTRPPIKSVGTRLRLGCFAWANNGAIVVYSAEIFNPSKRKVSLKALPRPM